MAAETTYILIHQTGLADTAVAKDNDLRFVLELIAGYRVV